MVTVRAAGIPQRPMHHPDHRCISAACWRYRDGIEVLHAICVTQAALSGADGALYPQYEQNRNRHYVLDGI